MAKRRGRGLRVNGNPNQLTNRQHVFPAASIQRFANLSGRVAVRHLGSNEPFGVLPTDDIFCAICVWDYRAESGYLLGIENRFQTIANEIVRNPKVALTSDQNHSVTEFWALWAMRTQFRITPRRINLLRAS